MSDQELPRQIRDMGRQIEQIRVIERPYSNISTRVYNSGAISIANNTLVALTFDSERWDDDGMHSTAGNTGRLTATRGGKHLFIATVAFALNSTGIREVGIRINGTTSIAFDSRAAIAGDATIITITTINDMAAGDYAEVVVFQNSGGALNVSASANYSPEFMAQRLP